MKSTQIRHFSLGFLTKTTLESRLEYWHSWMKPALSNLSTSSLEASILSFPWCRSYCLTGLYLGLMSSLWHMMLGGIPGISSIEKAKISQNSTMVAKTSCLTAYVRFLPILVFFPSKNSTSSCCFVGWGLSRTFRVSNRHSWWIDFFLLPSSSWKILQEHRRASKYWWGIDGLPSNLLWGFRPHHHLAWIAAIIDVVKLQL